MEKFWDWPKISPTWSFIIQIYWKYRKFDWKYCKIIDRRRLRLRFRRLISWKYFENIFALNHVSKMIAWSGLVFARGWLIEIMQSENFVKNSRWIKLESTTKVLHIGGSSTTKNGNQSKTKDSSEKYNLDRKIIINYQIK